MRLRLEQGKRRSKAGFLTGISGRYLGVISTTNKGGIMFILCRMKYGEVMEVFGRYDILEDAMMEKERLEQETDNCAWAIFEKREGSN